jgi:hypothetical protein
MRPLLCTQPFSQVCAVFVRMKAVGDRQRQPTVQGAAIHCKPNLVSSVNSPAEDQSLSPSHCRPRCAE